MLDDHATTTTMVGWFSSCSTSNYNNFNRAKNNGNDKKIMTTHQYIHVSSSFKQFSNDFTMPLVTCNMKSCVTTLQLVNLCRTKRHKPLIMANFLKRHQIQI